MGRWQPGRRSEWLSAGVAGARVLRVAWLSIGLLQGTLAQVEPEYEQAPIRYSAAAASNRVTVLHGRIAEGGFLAADPGGQVSIRAYLEALGVAVESQVLVFSKTSLQRKRIQPRSPRAVYFSDDCYVGWVPGGLLEVAVTDPALGLVFYRVDLRDGSGAIKFERDPECLSCHASSRTRGWPGLIVRSVFVDETGEPITKAGSFLISHESPLAERWGGWYVTGRHGRERHLGNVVARETAGGVDVDREAGANLTDLRRFFPTAAYLRPDSDLVALMVLEHQVTMHNRLAEGALRVRRWTHYQEQLQRELGEPVSAEPTGTARRVVESEAERILEYLLFCDEATLPEGGLQGAGDFERAFRKNRVVDGGGKSLKDFELRTRLFRYRCSYMIYSEAFMNLPTVLSQRLGRRLGEVLRGEETSKRFGHLGPGEREAIREILVSTKPGLLTGG